MVADRLTLDSIGLDQFVPVRLARRSLGAKAGVIRVMAPTILILEEKLAKGVWKMRGWTAREH